LPDRPRGADIIGGVHHADRASVDPQLNDVAG
jgi:hypothetical protein